MKEGELLLEREKGKKHAQQIKFIFGTNLTGRFDSFWGLKGSALAMNELMNVKFIILSHTTFRNDNTDFRQICPMCTF